MSVLRAILRILKIKEKLDLQQIYKIRKIVFYLGILTQIFTLHKTAGEGRDYFFNSSLPLPHASQTLRY